MLIKATYTDFYPKGTGIETSAVRVYRRTTSNKTRPATIRDYSLHLQLKDVPNGAHTYTIKLVDRAGNQKIIERKFTVAVAHPDAYGHAAAHVPSRPGLPARQSRDPDHPKPYDADPDADALPDRHAISVGPAVSVRQPHCLGSPIPSPSSSASPAGASGDGGGGSAAGFVGGTLLAMLPIGAAISYLALHRREDAPRRRQPGRGPGRRRQRLGALQAARSPGPRT